jgi:formamidopyrimidine-DNA glycosylase
MPELPEVERFKRIAEETLNIPIRSVRLTRPKLLSGIRLARFQTLFPKARFTQTRRHGKHLFLKIGRAPWMAMHFGLSGYLRVVPKPGATETGTLWFEFQDNRRLVYSALFGKITITTDPDDYIRKAGLGADALSMSFAAFEAIVRSGGGDIKQVLMDQRRIAGVGNMYSDEALFMARTHPQARAADLDSKTLRKIYDCVKKVLKEMVEARVHGEWNFPKGYLAHLRETGGRCPRCGTLVKTLAHGGRKAHYCPRCQRLPKPSLTKAPARRGG